MPACCWRCPAPFLLWRRSAGEPAKRLTLLVYGLTLAFCYLASTLYHGVRLPAARIAAFARLDSVGIFALIAGSYTPLAWCLLARPAGGGGRWCLSGAWRAWPRFCSPPAATSHPSWQPACTWGWVGASSFAISRSPRAVSHRALLPDRRRRPLLQRRGRAQRAALARHPAGDLRGPRAFSLLRAGGQPGSLPLHSQGRGAVHAGSLSHRMA